MPGPLRLEFAGVSYYRMNRVDHRKPIFHPAAGLGCATIRDGQRPLRDVPAGRDSRGGVDPIGTGIMIHCPLAIVGTDLFLFALHF